MSSSSTLVNVAEDAESRLVGLLSSSGRPSFASECDECLVNGDAAGLLKVIITDPGAMNELLNSEDESAAFSLLVALLERVPDQDKEKQLAEALVHAVETQVTDSKQQIRLLSALYNLRSKPSEKCSILIRIICLAPSLEGRLSEVINDIELLLDGWSLGQEERRPLYKAIAQKDESRKQRFTLLLLQTYDESSLDQASLEAAIEAAVGAIRDPITLFHEQRSMLETPAIQALASNDAKDLHGLLKVFQEGKLQDYRNFPNKEAVLSKYGLEDDCCTRHMRILSLCSLAAEMEEVPYDMVAQTLDVIPTEVESWVIQAVSSGLISAKMDQMHKRIMVERSVVRNFDLMQWKALQTQLQSWRDHVQSILDALKQADISSANN